MSANLAAALVAAVVSLLGVLGSAALNYIVSERRARYDFRTEFAAEKVARELLKTPRWEWRTFEVLQHHLGGFDADELRKILVRAGAIRGETAEGIEAWGLIERVRHSVIGGKKPAAHSLTFAPTSEPERTPR